MKEWQQHIYYIAGADIDTVSKSAFCEKLHKKGLEILYLVDPIDEYAMQQVSGVARTKTSEERIDELGMQQIRS